MADSSEALQLREEILKMRVTQESALKAKCDEIVLLMDELNLVNSDIAAMAPEEKKWKRRLHAAKKFNRKGGGTPLTPVNAADSNATGDDGNQRSRFVQNIALALFEFNEALSKKR